MAGDLDDAIRKIAKQQHKSLMAVVKASRDRHLALAGKAKDTTVKQRHRELARIAFAEGSAAAKRLQMSADNVADSYARAMRRAAEAAASAPTAAPKAAKPKAAKKKKAAKQARR
jgi:hypothetical protein